MSISLHVSYSVWKQVAQANPWPTYHDLKEVITGDLLHTYVARLATAADETDWSTEFPASTSVSSVDDARALIAGVVPAPAPQPVAPHETDYGGSSHWNGSRFTVTAGTTVDNDVKIPSAVKLLSGTYRCHNCAADGEDELWLQVVDVDGVYVPAGTVLKTYVGEASGEGLRPIPGERRVFRSGQSADIAADLYLRTKYKSTGGTDVIVMTDWLVIE